MIRWPSSIIKERIGIAQQNQNSRGGSLSAFGILESWGVKSHIPLIVGWTISDILAVVVNLFNDEDEWVWNLRIGRKCKLSVRRYLHCFVKKRNVMVLMVCSLSSDLFAIKQEVWRQNQNLQTSRRHWRRYPRFCRVHIRTSDFSHCQAPSSVCKVRYPLPYLADGYLYLGSSSITVWYDT
jgi:hypothetical protein